MIYSKGFSFCFRVLLLLQTRNLEERLKILMEKGVEEMRGAKVKVLSYGCATRRGIIFFSATC
jgi:hypothetical protein